jgi:hypothetical protein
MNLHLSMLACIPSQQTRINCDSLIHEVVGSTGFWLWFLEPSLWKRDAGYLHTEHSGINRVPTNGPFMDFPPAYS